MTKKNLIQSIKQAIAILLIAAFLGFLVNLFHPKRVQITTRRPSLKFAPDTLLAQDLPGVSFSSPYQDDDEKTGQIEEPLLVTTAQVRQLQSAGIAQLLDARTKAEFEKSHIPGAQNVPYQNLSANLAKLDSLPDDQWLICYCDGPPCTQAESLAYELGIAGYELVAVYFEGLKGWQQAGHEIAGKEAARHEN